jgi:hypothetical protein
LSRVNQTSRPKPAQGKGLKNGHVPNKEQTLLEQTNTVPTHHPVSEPNEQEGDLVLTQVLLQVEASGIRLNKTIRRTIQHLTEQLGTPATAIRVRNALSATQERQAQGTLRNPGGFFNKALREGYTANRAKVEARKQQTTAASLPDFHAVELAIDQALLKGDRTFALQKLQTLWAAGWHKPLAELLHLRRDWGFSLGKEGVRE